MTPLLSTALLRTQSDARLAVLAREGHELAFEAIVERYRRPLHGYCRRALSHARAEDAVQQTFLAAWWALRRGDEVRDLRAWLYRIAHNTTINAAKRAGYDYDELRDSLQHGATPEEESERRAVIRETLAGVAALPERQREALLRTAVEGRSQAEVASALGTSDGAVRELVRRARVSLRAAATAITPFPFATWAAGAGSGGGGAVTERIGELTAAGGTAGIGALVAKGGAAVVVAGAIAAGPVAVHRAEPGHQRSATAHAAASGASAFRSSAAATPDAGSAGAGTFVTEQTTTDRGAGDKKSARHGDGGRDGAGERSSRTDGHDGSREDHGGDGGGHGGDTEHTGSTHRGSSDAGGDDHEVSSRPDGGSGDSGGDGQGDSSPETEGPSQGGGPAGLGGTSDSVTRHHEDDHTGQPDSGSEDPEQPESSDADGQP